MEHLLAVVALALVLFVATNIDDVFVLLGFFADPRFSARQIVAGQCLGIAALFLASVAASRLALVLAPAWVGLLGLVPIALGLKQLRDLVRGDDLDDDAADAGAWAARGNVVAVAAVTVANGGDNLGAYIPLFATRPAADLVVIGIVFAVMTLAWLLAALWLVRHPTLGAPIRRHGHRLLPFVLIGLGVWILVDAGTVAMLAR